MNTIADTAFCEAMRRLYTGRKLSHVTANGRLPLPSNYSAIACFDIHKAAFIWYWHPEGERNARVS